MRKEIVYTTSFDHIFQVSLLDVREKWLQCIKTMEIPFGTYVAADTSKGRLYVGSEVFGGEGSITTLDNMQQTNPYIISQIKTGDEGPAYISVSDNGSFLLTCSYFSGTVKVFSLNADGIPEKMVYREALTACGRAFPEGTFGQAVPRCHCIRQLPGTDFVLVTDYSGDRILVYRLRQEGSLELAHEWRSEPGDAVRHLEFHPRNPGIVYANTEYTGKIYVLKIDRNTGTLVCVDSCQMTDASGAWMCANLRCSQDGRYLYNTSRKKGCLEVFALEAGGEHLHLAGRIPDLGGVRDFAFSKDGSVLLTGDQTNNRIHMFTMNQENGIGAPLACRPEVKTPACFVIL